MLKLRSFLLQIWKYTNLENDCVGRVQIWLIHRLGKTICRKVPKSLMALPPSSWSSRWTSEGNTLFHGKKCLCPVTAVDRPHSGCKAWERVNNVKGISCAWCHWRTPYLSHWNATYYTNCHWDHSVGTSVEELGRLGISEADWEAGRSLISQQFDWTQNSAMLVVFWMCSNWEEQDRFVGRLAQYTRIFKWQMVLVGKWQSLDCAWGRLILLECWRVMRQEGAGSRDQLRQVYPQLATAVQKLSIPGQRIVWHSISLLNLH